ncbi:LCP family protein [Nocardioides caldifontis]|uniref:LCP family protein n=1 Tax=Nocardioides caldifontis TaxID=2588938 RepID=UPI001EF02D3B|nr:LCP family protein [Nocardioides caldifontis]
MTASTRTSRLDARRGRGRAYRWRRTALLAVVLAVAALVVPDPSLRSTPASLVKVDRADGVDHDRRMVWVLVLGSDARPGDPPWRSRADAIQMVGLNLETGRGVMIGVPRDSYVPIPGRGSDKINAAMTYGGPPLMARAVGDLVGVRPDYVFTTTFEGLQSMVYTAGGVVVQSRFDITDPKMPGHVRQGRNRLDAREALFFSRARYALPRGDFDRSANQQALLRGTLATVRSRLDRPGFFERGVLSVLRNTNTDLSPVELYRLARAVTKVRPDRLRGCVIGGSFGTAGGASIVIPDVSTARRLGNEARNDGTFERGC